jgi:hypothetical protein
MSIGGRQSMSWKTIHADGGDWEIRAVASESTTPDDAEGGTEILEFVAVDGIRPTRRVAVPTGALASMDDDELLAAYKRSLPIGGDHYGRPGKRMRDVT